MRSNERPEIPYHYRGRGEGPAFTPLYSGVGATGGVLYPWRGKRECQADARSQGGRAVFIDPAVPPRTQPPKGS